MRQKKVDEEDKSDVNPPSTEGETYEICHIYFFAAAFTIAGVELTCYPTGHASVRGWEQRKARPFDGLKRRARRRVLIAHRAHTI